MAARMSDMHISNEFVSFNGTADEAAVSKFSVAHLAVLHVEDEVLIINHYFSSAKHERNGRRITRSYIG